MTYFKEFTLRQSHDILQVHKLSIFIVFQQCSCIHINTHYFGICKYFTQHVYSDTSSVIQNHLENIVEQVKFSLVHFMIKIYSFMAVAHPCSGRVCILISVKRY